MGFGDKLFKIQPLPYSKFLAALRLIINCLNAQVKKYNNILSIYLE